MAMRFRKSVKIGPVRMTASKSGISTSFGVKGYRVTKTASGKVRKTTSIPGTGVSFVSESGSKKRSSSGNGGQKKPFYTRWWFIALVLLVLIGSCSNATAGKSTPEATATPAPTAVATPVPERAAVQTEPTPEPVHTYIFNSSTNVFHRPDCRAVSSMKDENKIEITDTYQNMLANGYQACDICNPR